MSTSTSEISTELYDPLFHTPQDNLYEIYSVLREAHPVYYNASRDVWCLTRYGDVQSAARDWKRFANTPGVDLYNTGHLGPGNFLDDDPPRHDILRDVIRAFFVPKAIASLREDVARRVDEVLRDLKEKDNVDLANDFALRLPVAVISRLLGAPEEDDDLIGRLVLEIETQLPGQTTVSEHNLAAVARLREYLAELAEYKRAHPDDRILSRLVAGATDGAPTADELFGMAAILFIAGSETTFALLTNALELLAAHPDALRAVRRADNPGLLEATIEETLRFEAPVQWLARTVRETTTMHGVEIPAGERLILIWGAANRDPARWESPDTFDIYRKPQRHLGFGEGIHHCIGAPLARLEAQIAIPAFLRTFDDYQIRVKRRRDHQNVRGWGRLDATVVPHS
jgi:cytochrome P450